MADVSACSGIREEKGRLLLDQRCTLRHSCKRYDVHLNSTSQQQSYIKAQYNNGKCEMKKDL